MSYAQRVLQPGETVRHVSRLHWIVSLPGFILTFLGIVVFTLRDRAGADLVPVTTALATILFAVGLIALLVSWFRRWTTEIAVTDRRIIYKRGFIRRHTIEIHMDKVESVDVDQSVPGRIFGYGTIVIHGTGSSTEPLRMIESPIALRNQVTGR
jgi:uncharacterized membrane protein YdbT with pleckstrin-like domain